MDTELKDKLTKMAEAVIRSMEKRGLKVTLQVMVRQTQLPVARNARILAPRQMRRRLVNARLWTECEREIYNEWMAGFFADILRKQNAATAKVELSAARARQLELFPGFETLPTRIRSGSTFVKFPDIPVPQFLAYAIRYQKRSQQNQETAAELRRLATAVEPFAISDLTLAAAFERAQQPGVVVMHSPRIA
jgi:hypothetical protein